MDQLEPEIPSKDSAGDVSASPAVLSTAGLTKTFSGVDVVDRADVTFRRGEIHGIVGQNGAGKSSLMKMVCGVYKADGGHVRMGDDELVFSTPRNARDRGVAMVAQELSLVPALTVAENILLGQQPNVGSIINRRALRSQAKELIDSYDFGLDPDAVVSTLAPSSQQKVEILRALARDARLIILDEPTSSMSIDDSKKLYGIIRLLAERGTCVVLVSHFLEEILDVCDVVTIMRDGKVVLASEPTASLTTGQIVRHMVGETSNDEVIERSAIDKSQTPRLSVKDLSGPGFHDVSLDVYPGEIVALVGLVGAGRSEILRGIFGVDRTTSGTLEVDGSTVKFRRPADAIKAGIGMVTESRKHDGIFPVLPTTTNIGIGQPNTTTTAGVVRSSLMQRRSSEVADQVKVQGAVQGPIAALSGGNQQKALLARWLVEPPRLYLIDEPTRGVDVVSIQQIQALLRELAREGMSVLMVTSEFDEALALAHRIYTVRDGTIVHEVDAEEADKSMLLTAAFGTEEELISP